MDKKTITYSLLAHINNQSPKGSSYENIFIPLVKRGLSKMCATGQFKGDELNDIKVHIDELYGLDMPDIVLKRILQKIEAEINTSDNVKLKFYAGGSFIINDYVFEDFEEEITKKNSELEELQKYYINFLAAENKTSSPSTIFDF